MKEHPNVPTIVGLSAVAVVGSEPTLTGAAALDLARAEARHRRVTVVDLIGDAPPLRAVAATEDPHGVADCFVYGLSFSAVSRPTTVHPNVRIIPSGSEPIPYADALPSPRWDRLIEQARGKGGLIVFAVLISTPALSALTARVDCVVAAPSRLREVLEADQVAATAASRSRLVDRRPVARIGPAARVAHLRSRRPLAAALAAASVLLLLVAGWAVTRRRASSDRAQTAQLPVDSAPSRTDTVTSTAQLGGGAAGTDAAAAAAGAKASDAAAVAPVDPVDSSIAADFAVRIATYPSYIEALRALRQHPARQNAGTIAPVIPGGALVAASGGAAPARAPVYLLMAGAARAAGPLDSVAAKWPRQPGSAPSLVVRAPFALRLAVGVPTDSARRLAASWLARGVPAYVLVDPSGTSAVYAGAFDTTGETVTLATSLRAAGLDPVVAYRTGHVP
jgi:hypothetical protein